MVRATWSATILGPRGNRPKPNRIEQSTTQAQRPSAGQPVRYPQPRQGFRSGIEPVLLAASFPSGRAKASGGRNRRRCDAARRRRGSLGCEGWAWTATPCVAGPTECGGQPPAWPELRRGRPGGVAGDVMFDHGCANRITPPPAPLRRTQRARAPSAAKPGLFSSGPPLSPRLRSRGTLTFILPAAMLPACAEAFAAAGCPPIAMLPLWPRAGR